MGKEILKMEHITKIYPNGVMANRDVSFSVREGEIHALMGENGAGKSTLMKILFGDEDATEGDIIFEGNKIQPKSAADTIRLGIGMVHQHFMLVDSLRVYENVILGMEPKNGIMIDKEKAIRAVEETAKKYNLKIDPMAVVGELSVSQKQKVEILKVLLRGAKLLILDEPTAVLTPQETDELFEQLLLLKKNDHTIIFISHKIREVMQICDNITVLRNGRTVGSIPVANATEEDISRFMVGRDVILKMNKKPAEFGDTLLKVTDLTYENKEGRKLLDHVSFSLKKGQILGIAGVEGNGQNELAEAIFGFYSGVKGSILFDGKEILGKSIRIEGGNYILCDGSPCCENCCKSTQPVNYMQKKGENVMRIAVTYENGEVFQHFGRTENFKIYEVENNKIVNSQVMGSNGIGHGALAGLLSGNQIDVLICGGIGGGAQVALANAGITLCSGASGDTDKAVEAYLRGELTSAGATCSHHSHEEGHACGNHGCGHH